MKKQTLFTASQLSIALGITRIYFFSFGPRAQGKELRSYGSVNVFAPDQLPPELQGLLAHAKAKHHCVSSTDLVRFRLQQVRRFAINDLLKQRLAPVGSKAFAMRDVINHYLAERDCNRPEVDANLSAQAEFLKRFKQTISPRQIRRWATRVSRCGGPELAPIDAYADQKSVSHARGGERRNPRCSGDGRCTPTPRSQRQSRATKRLPSMRPDAR